MSACPRCRAPLAQGARFCGACGSSLDSLAPGAGPATGGPIAGSATAPAIGREVGGRYRILAKLGEGGMGAVYRAEQLSLKRTVALKVLRPELSAQPGLVRRFNAEAELAAKLNHANTVTLFDFGQDADGSLFIAMEYIEGRSLRALLQEGPVPAGRALAIGEQICASLANAHGHGIIHRDLKPDNVMLSRSGKQVDVVRVLDFGIAKVRDEGGVTQQPMTRAGDLLGTPQYMAPEQIRGERVDAWTDVYALGVLLYELVTGRLPFEGPTVMAILGKHLTEMPPSPATLRPDLGIPPLLDQLIMQCLQKEPGARPPTMEAIGERIAQLARMLGPVGTVASGAARPMGPPPGVPRRTDGQPTPATGPGAPSVPGQPGAVAAIASVAPFAPPAASPGYAPPATPPQYPPPGYASPPYTPPPYAAPQSPAPYAQPPYAAPPYAPPAGIPSPVPLAASHLLAAPPRRAGAGWWIVLASLLVGGVGGGAYVALHRSSKHATPADAGAHVEEAVVTRSGQGDVNPGTTYPHVLGFNVTVPLGFQPAGAANGVNTFSGIFNGTIDGIMVGGWPRQGWDVDQAEDNARAYFAALGGTMESLSATSRGGRDVLGGIVSFAANSSKAEFVIYPGASAVAVVLFVTTAADFDKTAALRQTLFDDWVRVP